MHKLKKLSIISCFALFISTSFAKDLNLEELITIALKNNTNIELSKQQANIKKEQVNKTTSSYLPNMSLNASTSQKEIEQNNVKVDDNVNSIGINANQLIYDFGKTTSNISSSKYSYNEAQNDLRATISKTILEVTSTYYDILNKYQQIEVAKEAVKLDELQLNQAQEYFKAGVRTKIDVTNAKLKLSNSKLKLIQAKYNLKTANTKLISILGKDLDSNINIKFHNQKIVTLVESTKYKDYSLENLISLGLEKREEIKKYKAKIEANRELLDVSKAEYLPRVDLDATYNNSDSDKITSQDLEQSSISLNLKWNFFTGFSTVADNKISLSKLSSSKKELQQQILDIKQEITAAHLNVKESIDSLNIGLLNVNLATENLNLANERYKAGLNDLIELNDAKLEYTQAKSSLVNIYYSYLSNLAKLKYSIGLINEEI
ncbi:hypothetical protein CRU99_12505 [Malaciobacter mytili]|uniref:TolC family protein n=1 Tax=Malaciobacter mytili TaxID=603050 RepID=UPI00100B55B4|nr:TolC family protein [Malaciobacter mytili]RXI37096.1 hypothetical protein CRU99_12505 [Malaciobacter mytili]